MASHFLERIKVNAVNDALQQAQWAEKKWVWVADKKEGYLAASIVKENGDEVEIQLDDNTKRTVNINDTEKMNPPKFDLVEDMAELTHLNEASVVHNLKLRYCSNLIYTYSGLFCVTVNPYKKLPIYSDEVIRAYKGKKRSEMPPHVYCVVDQAYNDMLNNRENQSILITGESGAGKTENTKKVIQYLAASSNSGQMGTLEQQILQANPMLEAFGNAQTIRNNNSSRFGKFIRLEFNSTGQIAGANIERYLLEKSRVTHQSPKERNYHVFYQLLKGATKEIKETLLLEGTANDYRFTKNSNKNIDGVDDAADFEALQSSLKVLNFSDTAQLDLFRILAAILHLGNITLQPDREDNAALTPQSAATCEQVCHVLGIPVAEFTRSLLKPRIKAGRDWVTQARNVEQVYYSIEALARSLYERMFGSILDRINETLYTSAQKVSFVGVLDIAGFEIFEEEYKREGIEWKFIDFGLDLQPTIDLIEKTSPVGILSLLDEECVMPKATDKTFIDKLNGLWKGKSPKYEMPRFNAGFILSHYAGKVEYSVAGWLDKNKDPLNENVTKLLSASSNKFIALLFEDSIGEESAVPNAKVGITKKGVFRTVAQKHKESLNSLMSQLYSTQPHFVRCIIPNEEKKPGKIDINLVLDQLRCNGVLEGIRICRAGFPNRLIFQDFRSRYEVLAVGVIPKGYIDGRKAATMLLDHLALDKNQYRIGASKIFFRAGVLADLENLRDVQLGKIVVKIQAMMRGYLGRKLYKRQIEQFRAIRIIQRNARIYVVLREWSWWKLYSKVKPLLNVTRTDEELKKRDLIAKEWEEKALKEAEEKAKIEALRLALEQEKKRIEEMLQQEKNAAIDQAEILTRTQKREVDLNERLADILKELEEKEAQSESLLAAKKKLEADIRQLQSQAEHDSSNLANLEKEKTSRDLRLKQIEEELNLTQDRVKKLESDKKANESQINLLEEQLRSVGGDNSELAKTKSKLQSSLTELEQKHEQELSEKKKLELKKSTLEQELTSAKNTITDLERTKTELELAVKKRESEISSLNETLTKQGAEKDGIELQRRELSVKLQSLQDDLQNERSEKEKLTMQKKRIEEEVEELHHLMQQKGNEETKQSEIRRLRDQEVANLKAQLESTSSDLEDTRKKGYLAVEKLNVELDAARQESANLSKIKSQLENSIKEVQENLERVESERGKIERSRRQLESEYEGAKVRIAELGTSLADITSQKELAEKQLAAVVGRADEYESRCSSVEREKATIQRNLESITEEMEAEIQKKQSIEAQRKRLSMELSDLQTRLEEEEASKNDALSKLATKTAELESLKEKYNADVTLRTAALEEAKKKAEKELVDLTARLEDQERQSVNLERTKARLSTEIEDLKLEIEREHTTAKNAERLLKQVEAQVNAANMNVEKERVQREVAESNMRKLQATVDSLQLSLEEKTIQIASLQKSKNDLDAELKTLINETGGGGKNVHELEKLKRRMESRIEELQLQLEVEETAKNTAEEAKKLLDSQFAEFRKQSELDLLAKDSLMEETRRMLMKEINSIGEQLDEANSQKNEAIKQKKRLEEQVQELTSAASNSAKGQSDMQKMKSKTEALVRELQARLEEEQKTRENIQELCYRHEKKANSLQSEIERIEAQVDAVERAKKQLEKKAQELDSELNSGEDSKANLMELKRRLLAENDSLKKQLHALEDDMDHLKAERAMAGNDTGVKGAALLEYEEKITKLEESRRALLAAQRLAAQELDEKSSELALAEKNKKQLQADLDSIKSQLEAEIVAKGEESAARRKLVAEQRELQLRYDAELLKTSDLTEALNLYKARADQALEKLEAAELGRSRSEKNETALKAQLKELEDNLNESENSNHSLSDRCKSLEDQILDLQAKLEESSHELAELSVAKRKLMDEFNQIHQQHRAEIDEREEIEDQARKKYQKEIKSMITDLEAEKSSNIQLKESVRELENELQSITIKMDSELRSSILWKKEKEKMELKLEDLTRNVNNLTLEAQERETLKNQLVAQVRELKAAVADKDGMITQLEKSRKSFEQRLADLDQEFSATMKLKSEMNKSVMDLDKHNQSLKEQLDEHERDIQSSEERARRAEAHATELQQELSRERGVNIELEKAKLVLERSLKEINSRLFELEALNLSRDTNTTRRLESRIEELQNQLEAESREKSEHMKNARRLERTLRDVQFQVGEKDKLKQRYDEEQEKMDQKLKRMKQQLDELELSESNLQLAKRKAEREAAEYKEKATKYEKEIERFKSRPVSSI